MKPFDQFPCHLKNKIRYILTDIDDTLTIDGNMSSVAFAAMERLQQAGIHILPITGRPAGWCDHIARMWPVDGVVGENGAFYFRYDHNLKKMSRRYVKSERERKEDHKKLIMIEKKILKEIPDCKVASDQAYRETDLAIDFCEDIPPLPMEQVEQIVHCFNTAGAQAKISSIHVNGWFGDHDKLTSTILLFKEVFKSNLGEIKNQAIYIGDSPNDSPMFDYFPHGVGVANVLHFEGKMECEPTWITKLRGGNGFSEMVHILLEK